jgi:hypothetical protein
MKSSTGHSHPALRRTQFTVVPLAVRSLTGRYVGLHAAGTPFLRANYSGVSGAFALFWILSERGLFTKHGFER